MRPFQSAAVERTFDTYPPHIRPKLLAFGDPADPEGAVGRSGFPGGRHHDATPGQVMPEFGTDWCGHCRRTQPLITEAVARHPGVQHIRVIDGPGKPLGRSFGVKLWPTVVLLREGREVSRFVRPSAAEEIARAVEELQA